MRFALLTEGTRGDVQPFVALARGLSHAGHMATLVAPVNYAAFAAAHGVEFAPLRADYQALMESDEARAMLENPLQAVRYWRGLVLPMVRTILDDAWAAAAGADVVVSHPKVLGGADIAERLGAGCFLAMPVPLLTPTRAFPAPGVVSRDLGGSLNRLTFMSMRGITLPFRGVLNRWRAEMLGLPARPLFADPYRLAGKPIPVLYPFSPSVVPPPVDWPAWAHITGYWFLDEWEAWTPPPDLLAFLAAGAPPVYVGFGSMAGQDPARTTRIVVEAVERSGQRAVIATGWGGLVADSVPESVHVIEAVRHDWLFPRVAAVVHHGGAGTTAEGLRAGIPTVICPFFGDQPFWGRRIHALGLGPEPIRQKRMTSGQLAEAIRTAATDPNMRRRAAEVGAQIRSERGVEQAVRILEASLDDLPRRRRPSGEAPGRT